MIIKNTIVPCSSVLTIGLMVDGVFCRKRSGLLVVGCGGLCMCQQQNSNNYIRYSISWCFLRQFTTFRGRDIRLW